MCSLRLPPVYQLNSTCATCSPPHSLNTSDHAAHCFFYTDDRRKACGIRHPDNQNTQFHGYRCSSMVFAQTVSRMLCSGKSPRELPWGCFPLELCRGNYSRCNVSVGPFPWNIPLPVGCRENMPQEGTQAGTEISRGKVPRETGHPVGAPRPVELPLCPWERGVPTEAPEGAPERIPVRTIFY